MGLDKNIENFTDVIRALVSILLVLYVAVASMACLGHILEGTLTSSWVVKSIGTALVGLLFLWMTRNG